MTGRGTLIVGVGNRDRGDDAVGCVVAAALAGRVPAGVACIDHDGEPLGLMACWEGAARVVLVDAVASGAAPGHIVRYDLAREPLPADVAPCSTHAVGLPQAVELARVLGRLPPAIRFIGVEGAAFDAGRGLSPPVGEAAEAVVTEILAGLG
ncbi:hydrogenase maturation protease [Roseospira goensis]|uniref:Hydrogenase maturation protease n=1 Tax=Roseospira goensis TaxID=391922 RepID=A0A7W6RWX5_9PROT|nr:hydrogenase maturation protease [Roseospira goensis]MBB4284591.1 hydrogenase maturation protease [Roseospira goensis]